MLYLMPDVIRNINHVLVLLSLCAMLLLLCIGQSYAQQTIIWASSSAPEQPVFGDYTNIQLEFGTSNKATWAKSKLFTFLEVTKKKRIIKIR